MIHIFRRATGFVISPSHFFSFNATHPGTVRLPKRNRKGERARGLVDITGKDDRKDKEEERER